VPQNHLSCKVKLSWRGEVGVPQNHLSCKVHLSWRGGSWCASKSFIM
jgi:hypothetical protein